MPADLPTAIPGPSCLGDQVRFQQAARRQVSASLARLASATGLDLDRTQALLADLSAEMPWRSELWMWAGQLGLALRGGGLSEALDATFHLSQVLASRPYARQQTIGGIYQESWEHTFLARPGGGRQLTRAVADERALDRMTAHVQDALDLLRAHCPEILREFEELVQGVRLFVTRQEPTSFSTLDTQGTVFFGLPHRCPDPIYECVEMVVHETAHVRLNTLMYPTAFYTNSEAETYAFPRRPTPGSMRLIFHVPFVYARILHVWSALLQHAPSDRFMRQRLCETWQRYGFSLRQVEENCRPTAAGRAFLRSLPPLVSRAADQVAALAVA